MRKPRPYPTETTDDAFAVGAPSLPVIATLSPQRLAAGRMIVHAVGWIGRPRAPGRVRPTDFSPWKALSQQPPRWVDGGWFDAIGTE